MSDNCYCCFKRKRMNKLRQISDRLRSAFEDLIGTFKLNEGFICKMCRRNLQDFVKFKKKILKKQEKFGERTIKLEVNDPFTDGLDYSYDGFDDSPVEVQTFVPKCEPPAFSSKRVTGRARRADTWSEKFQEKLAEIDNLHIPRDMRRMVNVIVEIPTGSDDVKRFRKDCSVAQCSKSFVMLMDKRRIRYEGYKRHLEQHFPVNKPKSRDNSLPAKKLDESVASSEFIDFIPETSQLPQIQIKEENLDKETFVEVKEPSSSAAVDENIGQSEKQINFRCTYCSSIFTKAELLREHYREVHRGFSKRPERKRDKCRELCPFCGVMLLKECIKKHISTVHYGEKNHCCSDCGKAFTTKPQLNNHWAYHHNDGARDYGCDLCPRRFPSKYSIRKHMISVHCPEKAHYKCTFCLKGFNRKPDLERHLMRGIHDENEVDDGLRANINTNKFHCPQCDRRYVNKSYLQQHIKRSH